MYAESIGTTTDNLSDLEWPFHPHCALSLRWLSFLFSLSMQTITNVINCSLRLDSDGGVAKNV